MSHSIKFKEGGVLIFDHHHHHLFAQKAVYTVCALIRLKVYSEENSAKYLEQWIGFVMVSLMS